MTAHCTTCELHAESTFTIEGMDCREEVVIIERRFKQLTGIEDVSADVMHRRLHVKYDAARLSASTIVAAIADTGMRAWLEHEEPLTTRDETTRRRQWLLAGSGAGLAAGLVAPLLNTPPLLTTAVLAASLVCGVSLTLRKAWQSVRVRSLDINVLMLLAATGAVALNQWSEAAAVVFLFAIAQALEARTLDRARTAVHALIDLTPDNVLVEENGIERSVGIDAVLPGSVIHIKPGEKVPLDGLVVSGTSAVNQAPITGESIPVEKGTGDDVFAGTINGRGALVVRVTHARRDTTLARIVRLVEQAQAQRAPVQAFIERFARLYTPAVVALAVVVAVVPPLLGAAWSVWTYRALVLLVVACPCALVISTPVSIVAALAAAARRGVLIKGGVHLETIARVRCVAFDKTGTLTVGRPEVVDVVPLAGISSDELLALAASIERRSEHPIAAAITEYARQQSVRVPVAAAVASLVGGGAEGSIGEVNVLLGSHRMFEARALCSDEIHARLDEISARGQTPVLVARDRSAIGVIAIADRPRPAGADALDLLRRQGIQHLAMLTGDSEATAQSIARTLGIDAYRAELLPADKAAAVADLRRQFGPVAMVGDGINDAPALATADLGIVMGAIGSDAAIETADVALMADELLKIPYVVRLGRATLRNIKANLAISVALKAAFVFAAIGGFATLWMAVLADTGATVIVIANALRLLRAD
jgi:Cd2+/Zn2+-exporting ATPase